MAKRLLLNTTAILSVLAFLFCAYSPLTAASVEEKDGTLVIGEVMKIHSKILDEERTLWIHLPDDYTSSTDHYPVLFLLDGSGNFLHVTGLIDFLYKNSLIPSMIIVAVLNTDRNRDFLPTRMNDFPPVAGADKFLAFIKDELTTFVDENYRTASYRILCGHSYGGLFTIYSFLNYPGLFNASIAISPSAYWDDRLMFKKAEALFAGKPDLKNFIYIAASGGDKEEIRTASKDFAALLEKLNPKGLESHFLFLENEDHGSGPHRALYNALETLYSGWRIDTKALETMPLDGIREHYRKLSEKYGYQIPIPNGTIDFKAFLLYRAKKYDEAIELIKFNVANHPDFPIGYRNLGWLYKTTGKLELALKNYEIALKLAEKTNHRILQSVKEMITQITEEMKAKEKTKTD